MRNHEALKAFITDFKLMRNDGIVVFPARIQFHISEHTKSRYTEVQILLGDNLDTIYLINPDLPFEDLPDTFMSEASTYKYVPHDHLLIGSRKDPGVYTRIFPVVLEE